jgi:hypothetical protein
MSEMTARCSFSERAITDERHIVRGKFGVLICPQCVRFAAEFFDESLGEAWRAASVSRAAAGAEFTERPPRLDPN